MAITTLKRDSSSSQALAANCSTFTRGNEFCGIPALNVREIIRMVDGTTVPRLKQGNQHCAKTSRSIGLECRSRGRRACRGLLWAQRRAETPAAYRVAGN